MRLTLLRAKEALRHRSPEDRLEFRLNRVCERLLSHGKFNGSLQRLNISAPYGQLALPRHYRTVEGAKVNGSVHDLGNRWYEFIPGTSECSGCSMDLVRDLGDGWAIMRTPHVTSTGSVDISIPGRDIPEDGTIEVDFTGADQPDIKVLIEGMDSEGLTTTLEFTGKQTLANPFASISRIHKDFSNVSVRVIYATDTAEETTLAIMEPTEEETFYRRYMIDGHSNSETLAVTALCKRRHIEFTNDRDILPFSNIYALERGLDALQYDAENDVNLADQYWMKAVDALNDELKDTNPATALPVIRFHYPGRTKPKWTSFY